MTATPQDLAKLDALISGNPEAPERIYGWMDTQMSIARHYGGLTYQGQSYRIAAHEDGQPLVRWDVIKREAVEAKVRAKADKQAAKLAQGVLL